MANELAGADRFLYQTLAADPTLSALIGTRIYAGLAPQGATFPYLVFSHQGGLDRLTTGGQSRVFTRPVYTVKVVSQKTSYAEADTIASQVDAVLLAGSGPVVVDGVTYQVMSCHRTEPFRYLEPAAGSQYRHVGGYYTLFIHT